MSKEEKKENQLAKKEESVTLNNLSNVSVIDVNSPLPDLSKAEALNVDLISMYWTPSQVGEAKKLIYMGIELRSFKNTDGDMIELPSALFLEQLEDMTTRSVVNASAILVNAFETLEVQKQTPVLITYLGKKKNKSNQFSCDNWSVKPLIINI